MHNCLVRNVIQNVFKSETRQNNYSYVYWHKTRLIQGNRMYLDDNKNFDVLIFVEMQLKRILKRSAVHTYLFAGGWGGGGYSVCIILEEYHTFIYCLS